MHKSANFVFTGTMIDACIRVVDDEGNLLAVLCLSFLSNELFGITSEIENTGDAYPFLIDNSGIWIFINIYLYAVYFLSLLTLLNYSSKKTGNICSAWRFFCCCCFLNPLNCQFKDFLILAVSALFLQ